MPSAGAKLRQAPCRIGQQVIGLDHRRRMAQPLGLALEEFGLALQPEILERRRLAFAQV